MSQAFVPAWIDDRGNTALQNIATYGAGVIGLALLAQMAIPLPWTPVPITGQTFGVTLIALLFGKTRGFSIVATYVLLGLFGFPFLATAQLGPTAGYIVGMLLSALVVGHFADLGWTKSFIKTWFAGFLGSLCVFTCGLAVLSFFVPSEALLMSGLFPFLAGDAIKTVTAASIAYGLNKKAA